MMNTAKIETKGGLGPDLPDTEAELFELDRYPLFDIEVGRKIVGSETAVRDLLKDIKLSITDDSAFIKKAHAEGDWEKVENLAHKMKGSSDYGTIRMHHALMYVERYRKAGHTQCLEQLYVQMLLVIDDTMDYMDGWLHNT